jgi:hypothetical protein
MAKEKKQVVINGLSYLQFIFRKQIIGIGLKIALQKLLRERLK